jgi:nicotinamidase-related amidase
VVDFDVVPARTVLLNIDMQNCFVAAAVDGLATLDRVNRLAEVCRSAGIVVIHTCHVLEPDGSNMGLLGEFVAGIKRGMLSRGSESTGLHPELVVDPRDLVVEKPRFGAFYDTDLEEILRARGIESVIISGISTDVCCDTTAREANARDLQVFFASDGTAAAGPNPFEVQHKTLALIGALFGQVLTVEEMTRRITRSAEVRRSC